MHVHVYYLMQVPEGHRVTGLRVHVQWAQKKSLHHINERTYIQK